MKKLMRLFILISVCALASARLDATQENLLNKNVRRLAIVAGTIGGFTLAKTIYDYFQKTDCDVVESLEIKDILTLSKDLGKDYVLEKIVEKEPIKISEGAKQTIDDIFDLKLDYYAVNTILNSSSDDQKRYFGYKALAAIIKKDLFTESCCGKSPKDFCRSFIERDYSEGDNTDKTLLFAWRMFMWHAFTDKNFFKKYFCNDQQKIDWKIINSYGVGDKNCDQSLLRHLSGYTCLSFFEYCMLRGYTDFLPDKPEKSSYRGFSSYLFCLAVPIKSETWGDCIRDTFVVGGSHEHRNSEDLAVLCKCLCANQNLDKEGIIFYLNRCKLSESNTQNKKDSFEWWRNRVPQRYLPSNVSFDGRWKILSEYMSFYRDPFQDIAGLTRSKKPFSIDDKIEILMAFQQSLSKINGWNDHVAWFWKNALFAFAEFAGDEGCLTLAKKISKFIDFESHIKPELEKEYSTIVSICVHGKFVNILLWLKEQFPKINPFEQVVKKRWNENEGNLIENFLESVNDTELYKRFCGDYREYLKKLTENELKKKTCEKYTLTRVSLCCSRVYSEWLLLSKLCTKDSYFDISKMVAAGILENVLAGFSSVMVNPKKDALIFTFPDRGSLELCFDGKVLSTIFEKYCEGKKLEQALKQQKPAQTKDGKIILPSPKETVGSFFAWLTSAGYLFKQNLHAQRKNLSNSKSVCPVRYGDIVFSFNG